jgi:hypothetical protein
MSPRVRRIATLVLLAGVALPLMVGCPALLNAFIRLKICVLNNTFLDLTDVNVVESGAASWGANDLPGNARILPGGQAVIKNIAPGTYDIRTLFDDKEECGNDSVVVTDVDATTTNIIMTWDQLSACSEVYLTLDFVL